MNDYVDFYCERLEPGLWAEPLNAVSNFAFLIAAVFAYRGLARQPKTIAHLLCLILFIIGIGSGLLHTFSTRWAAAADVIPIQLFIVVYIFAANRDYFGMNWIAALAVTMGTFAFMMLMTPWVLESVSFMGSTAAYLPVCLLIWGYGFMLLGPSYETGKGLLIGASILSVSMACRWADLPVCDHLPIGTHYAWHFLNAAMLWWMIRVYRQHMLAQSRTAV